MLKPKQIKQLLAVLLSVEYILVLDHGEAIERCPICCEDKPNHGLNCMLDEAIQLLKKEAHVY